MKINFLGLDRTNGNIGWLLVRDGGFLCPAHTRWSTEVNLEKRKVTYREVDEPGIPWTDDDGKSFYPLMLGTPLIESIKIKGTICAALFIKNSYLSPVDIHLYNRPHTMVYFGYQPVVNFHVHSEGAHANVSGKVGSFNMGETTESSYVNITQLDILDQFSARFLFTAGTILSHSPFFFDLDEIPPPHPSPSSRVVEEEYDENDIVETSRMRHVRENIKIPKRSGLSPLPQKDENNTHPCVIACCEKGVADALFLPCQCQISCLECAEGLRSTPFSVFKCPLCRQEINSVIESSSYPLKRDRNLQYTSTSRGSLHNSKRQRR